MHPLTAILVPKKKQKNNSSKDQQSSDTFHSPLLSPHLLWCQNIIRVHKKRNIQNETDTWDTYRFKVHLRKHFHVQTCRIIWKYCCYARCNAAIQHAEKPASVFIFIIFWIFFFWPGSVYLENYLVKKDRIKKKNRQIKNQTDHTTCKNDFIIHLTFMYLITSTPAYVR